jgi:arylformamidase
VTTVGGEESSEFHRQTALIRDRWAGPSIGADIPLPGRNHFSACDALAEPGGPLFEACLELLEAAQPRTC